MARQHLQLELATLVWARESIGLSIEEAAKRLNVNRTKLRMWEIGAEGYEPTIADLREMSRVYQRPLAAFFLKKPPKTKDTLPDFRVLSGHSADRWSPEMHQAYRRAQRQRRIALELFGRSYHLDDEEFPTFSIKDNSESAADEIRRWLGLGAQHVSFRDFGSRSWLQFYSDAVERHPILVIQAANIDKREMRGFALSERPFPVIAINVNDGQAPRLFTLMHELIHILMGSSSMCDLQDRKLTRHAHDVTTERFCNRVAAAVLMPALDLLARPIVETAGPYSDWSIDRLESLASLYGVSAEAMMIRLVTLSKASESSYWSHRAYFQRDYDPELQDDEEMEKPSKPGGPRYYRRKIRDYGRKYVGGVIAAYRRGEIELLEAAEFLDARVNHLDRLEREAAG